MKLTTFSRCVLFLVLICCGCGRSDAKSLPELIEMVQSPDPAVQIDALNLLGHMGPEAKEAVPAMIPTLNSPVLLVRQTAAAALGKMGEAAKDAVSALAANLDPKGVQVPPPPSQLSNSPDFEYDTYRAEQIAPLQLAAATALANMGPEARPALAALEHYTQQTGVGCGNVKTAIAKLKQ